MTIGRDGGVLCKVEAATSHALGSQEGFLEEGLLEPGLPVEGKVVRETRDATPLPRRERRLCVPRTLGMYCG